MSTSRIDELRSKFDENPRRYFAPLANEYRKAGDLTTAIALCREHLPKQPGHMSGHIVYGQALYEAGALDESRQVFEAALALDPENLIALRHLCDIARASGDNALARRWYERMLDADPRNDEIAQQLATFFTPATAQPAISATKVDDFAPHAGASHAAPEEIEVPDFHPVAEPTPAAGFDATMFAPVATPDADLRAVDEGESETVVAAHAADGVIDVYGEDVFDEAGPAAQAVALVDDIEPRTAQEDEAQAIDDAFADAADHGDSYATLHTDFEVRMDSGISIDAREGDAPVVTPLAGLEATSDDSAMAERDAAEPIDIGDALDAFGAHDPVVEIDPNEFGAPTALADVDAPPSLAAHDFSADFEEGLVAPEWPDTSALFARSEHPPRVTPSTPTYSQAAVSAFGREDVDPEPQAQPLDDEEIEYGEREVAFAEHATAAREELPTQDISAEGDATDEGVLRAENDGAEDLTEHADVWAASEQPAAEMQVSADDVVEVEAETSTEDVVEAETEADIVHVTDEADVGTTDADADSDADVVTDADVVVGADTEKLAESENDVVADADSADELTAATEDEAPVADSVPVTAEVEAVDDDAVLADAEMEWDGEADDADPIAGDSVASRHVFDAESFDTDLTQDFQIPEAWKQEPAVVDASIAEAVNDQVAEAAGEREEAVDESSDEAVNTSVDEPANPVASLDVDTLVTAADAEQLETIADAPEEVQEVARALVRDSRASGENEAIRIEMHDGAEPDPFGNTRAPQPTPARPAPSHESPAFVTETMAELLISQGFIERAATVYEELVRRRPYDPVLVARLDELRVRLAGDAEAATGNAATEAAGNVASEADTGEWDADVTDDYQALPERTEQAAPSTYAVETSMPTPIVAPRAVSFDSDEVEQARVTARERFARLATRRVPRRTPPRAAVAIEVPADSLAGLFGATEEDKTNDYAARAFADAFAPMDEPPFGASHDTPAFVSRTVTAPSSPTVSSAPSRVDAAPSQHTPSSGRAATTGFSFDRFFPDPATVSPVTPATPAVGAKPPSPTPASSSPQSPPVSDDLAEFAAWLKGLDKP